jgi:phenylalanyl-tRNA synthetase alpha chain
VQEKISTLRHDFQSELSKTKEAKDVENLKVKYLGRKGPIQELMMGLRDVPSHERPQTGKIINDLKEEISQICEEAHAAFVHMEQNAQIAEEKIDVTLPGRRQFLGRKHPIHRMLDEVIDVLSGMGFTVQYGPDIDSDYYNFEGLNYPKDHPARDMQDTYYINSEYLLRSQTSNTQLRVMESYKPPIRVIAPGTVYRNETINARSHVFFHQVEGLYIDKGVTFADLLGTMNEFLSKLYSKDVETRFRPSFFPFTEPSMEVDIRCTQCSGSGCRICKHSGWLEILGCGMVHPQVLINGGIDPEEYSGYAWGMGIERMAMLRYGINDIRLFTENDQRFLAQF